MSNFHFDLSLKLSQGEVHDFSGEVQKLSGEVQNDLRGGAHLLTPPLKIQSCFNEKSFLIRFEQVGNARIVVAFTTFTGCKYNFACRGNKYTQTHKQFNNIKLQTFEITQQCQFY